MDWTPKDTSAVDRLSASHEGRGRGLKRKSAKAARPRPEFVLDALEPRLLLSASPMQPPTEDAAALPDTSVIVQEADVTVAAPAPEIPADTFSPGLVAQAASGTATAGGRIYDWGSHVTLANVSVTLTGDGGSTVTSGSDGSFSQAGLSAGTYGITATLPATQLGRAITSASALAALRLATGVNPNPTVNGSQVAVSPYQLIAADVNGDGRVTSADALNVLRMAVGASNAPQPKWQFVNESTTYWDAAAQTSTVTRQTVPTSFPASVTVGSAGSGVTANLVAVLTGDVLGRYVPYDANGTAVANPNTLPTSYFTGLSGMQAAPASTWGVSGAGTATLLAGLLNDTGVSATDGITSDPTITGSAAGVGRIVSLKGGFDSVAPASYANLSDTLSPSGGFTLTATRLAAVLGSTLTDGTRVLHLVATDVNGNAAATDVSVTLSATSPSLGPVALTAASGSAADNTTNAASVALTGTSTAGATVTLTDAAGTVVGSGLAGAGGAFQIAGVGVAQGANTFTATARDKAGNLASRQVTVTRQGTVSADQTLIWNQAALDTFKALATYPEDATRVLAMVGLAQYDTLAAIQGTPAFLVSRNVTGPVSIELALAKAADTVLDNLFPSRKGTYDAILASLAATVPDGAAKTAALALGADIGQAVYDIRATDGSDAFVDYSGSTAVGKWRPTAPTYLVAEDPQWGSVTPFALTSGSEFRAAAPPDTTSDAYAVALNEVKSLGSATSTTRTADQTQTAQFWADGKGSYTPPGHWVQIAEQVALARGNSLADNVRLFAQLNVALADSAIAAWDTKFAYGTWRPDTAIQNADADGNAATVADPNWRPLLIDPAHPDYVSGHSTFSTAAATVLARAFGDDTTFTTGAVTLPGVTRSFTSFSQAAAESGLSRIYAGIHTRTANAAGATIGAAVATAVMDRFSLSQDLQPPTIVVPLTPAVTNANLTLAGSIVDNISGVKSARYSIDGATAKDLALDTLGRFSITTALATDGTADGAHTVTLTTSDAAGNAATPFVRAFTLDTRAPTISLASLAQDAVLTDASRLTGAADPTGSGLIALSYAVDGGRPNALVFDKATGAFDAALPIGNLAIGAHKLVLSATDAAGNTATLTRSVSVAALGAFTVTKATPTEGATDVGTTQRPQVFFSRAVNAATLTAASFYATGPDGSVLSTTIVPADDGSFAWLFFNSPMPGGATVTIHVVGSSIRAAADAAFLDGDADGTAGGTFTYGFTTVNLAPVIGTKLVGRVVDPGPDLQPMTFDDIGRGPDGIIHTADDVFKLPIAHAKVYILGREDVVVYTDANGLFELDDIPSGTVKVAVDGRTATNPPSGVFFPEMVMSAEIRPGVTNTLMDTVGTDESKANNAGRLEVYLPRVPSSALQTVADAGTTVITANQSSARTLTVAEAAALSLVVPAGSAVGADGKALSNVSIGIATVPAELVKDMLPPGVLQHTFDITIQAPGVSTFTTPVQITFPNVFNAAPGTKLNVLSFDHTTGMLVINGTATVSADGLTVVSDPDSGIKGPGWHGLAPTGSETSGPNPPSPDPKTCDVLEGAKTGLKKEIPHLLDVAIKDLVANITGVKQFYAVVSSSISLMATMISELQEFKEAKDKGEDPSALFATFKVLNANKERYVKIYESIADLAATETPVGKLEAVLKSIKPVLAEVSKQCDILKASLDASKCSSPSLDIACYSLGIASALVDTGESVLAFVNGGVKKIVGKAGLAAFCATLGLIEKSFDTPKSFSASFISSGGLAAQSIDDEPIYTLQARQDPVGAKADAADLVLQALTQAIDLQSDVKDVEKGKTLANQILTSTLSTGSSFADLQATALGQIRNGFYLLTDLTNGFELRGKTDPYGSINASLAANSLYQLEFVNISDVSYGLTRFETNSSGVATKIANFLVTDQTGELDADSDGLSDAIERVIGSNINQKDSNTDGLSDLFSLQNGVDVAGNASLATGVVSTAALRGNAAAVAIASIGANSSMLAAFVATGASGLSIVDVTDIKKPTVLSELGPVSV